MRKKHNKLLALFLVVLMLVSIFPRIVFAEGNAEFNKSNEIGANSVRAEQLDLGNPLNNGGNCTTCYLRDGTAIQIPGGDTFNNTLARLQTQTTDGFWPALAANPELGILSIDLNTGMPMAELHPDALVRFATEKYQDGLLSDAEYQIVLEAIAANASEKYAHLSLKEILDKARETGELAEEAIKKLEQSTSTRVVIPPPPSTPSSPGDPPCLESRKFVCLDCCATGLSFPPGPWQILDKQSEGEKVVGLHSSRLYITPEVPENFTSMTPEDQKAWRDTHIGIISDVQMLPFGILATNLAEAGAFDAYRASDTERLNSIFTKGGGIEGLGGSASKVNAFNQVIDDESHRALKRYSDSMVQALKDLAEIPPDDNIYLHLGDENEIGLARGAVFTVTRYVRRMEVTFWHNHRERPIYGCQDSLVASRLTGSTTVCANASRTAEVPLTPEKKLECVKEDYRWIERCSGSGRFKRCWKEKEKYCSKHDWVTHMICDGKKGHGWHCKNFWDDYWRGFPIVVSKEQGIDPAASKVTTRLFDREVWDSTQYIGVRCQTDKLGEIINEINGGLGFSGSSDNNDNNTAEFLKRDNFWSLAKSPTVKGQIADFFNDLDVEFFYHSGPLALGPGEDSFDNSCSNSTTCVTPKGRDILKKSDIINNQGNEGDIPGEFGAQANGAIGRYFKLFRDGQENDIRVDIPIPEFDSDIVTLDTPAEKTIINRWSEGTPKDDKEYELKTNNGQLLFRNGQTQEVLDGEVNRFIVSSTWASETNKPHKYSFTFRYRPTITSSVPGGLNTVNTFEPTPLTEDILIECERDFYRESVNGAAVHTFAKPNVDAGREDIYNEGFHDGTYYENNHLGIEFIKSGMN